MKTEVFATLLLLAPLCAHGQGTTYLYDQQSSTYETPLGYGVGQPFQNMLPTTGQSFTPTLSAIDFIRLKLSDGSPTDGLGSTWFLNLRSTSITGPILGTTASVGLPNGHDGTANFFFPNTISLTRGTTYFFDINSPDGGAWNMDIEGFNYQGGTAWGRGASQPGADYWFREGIIVPEPSSAALLVLGGLAIACLRHSRGSKQAVLFSPCQGVPLSTKPARTALTTRWRILSFQNIMKTEPIATLLLLTTVGCYGQGTTFLYDQQSSTNEGSPGYGFGTPLKDLLPNTGQSFTPTFSGIDFIRLNINDGNPGDGLGSTWFLNLRSTSITGPILGTTASTYLPDGFTDQPNFFFPNTIPLTPGTQYFFDVNSADGGSWNVIFYIFNFSGGVGYERGFANPAGSDYWFREGLVVPEPSSAALLLLGGAAIASLRHSRRK